MLMQWVFLGCFSRQEGIRKQVSVPLELLSHPTWLIITGIRSSSALRFSPVSFSDLQLMTHSHKLNLCCCCVFWTDGC